MYFHHGQKMCWFLVKRTAYLWDLNFLVFNFLNSLKTNKCFVVVFNFGSICLRKPQIWLPIVDPYQMVCMC
jgi:hypothetical protein